MQYPYPQDHKFVGVDCWLYKPLLKCSRVISDISVDLGNLKEIPPLNSQLSTLKFQIFHQITEWRRGEGIFGTCTSKYEYRYRYLIFHCTNLDKNVIYFLHSEVSQESRGLF